MDSFVIENTKKFMSSLLVSDVFDDFYFEGAKITTFNTFSIDGLIKKDFFFDEENSLSGSKYSKYSAIKPYLYEIIKGKRTPLFFQIVLHAPLAWYENNDFEAGVRYILTIRFEDGKLCCISGISRSEFTLDKTSDLLWDKRASQFLEQICS